MSDLTTDLNAARPISAGGTGATTAAGARTALGVSATDATITAIAALSFDGTNGFLRATAADTFVAEAAAAHRTALGLGALSTVTPGTGVATALAVNVGSAGAPVLFNGALGTPSSATLTNATGLPVSTGVSGLGSNIATFLATPSSANLIAAITDETGSGALVFGTSPTITTPTLSGALTGSTGKIVLNNAIDAVRWGHTNTDYYIQGFSNAGNGFAILGFNMRQGTTSNTVRTDASNKGVGMRGDSGAITFTAANTLSTDNQTPTDFLEVRGDVFDIRFTGTPTALAATSLGYRGLGNISTKGAAYTFALADAGQLVQMNDSGANAFQIPPNSSVAFPIGTVIPVQNVHATGTATVTEGSGVTLSRGDGTAGTGTRTLANNGPICALVKESTNGWRILGNFT